MIEVLVVDDDVRVARVNAAYVDKVPGFHAVTPAHSAAEALERVETLSRVDLVLMDHYLPDETGLDVVREMRRRGHQADVIMVTPARDVATVQAANAARRAAIPGQAVRLRPAARQAGGVRAAAPHPRRRR
ncbi:Protein-glutamate methylesterase/protein-glutamine glutaminase [Streptomyces tendae]